MEESVKNKEKCCDCRFWELNDRDSNWHAYSNANCQRHAPVACDDGYGQYSYPQVGAFHWCGDFVAKEELEHKEEHVVEVKTDTKLIDVVQEILDRTLLGQQSGPFWHELNDFRKQVLVSTQLRDNNEYSLWRRVDNLIHRSTSMPGQHVIKLWTQAFEEQKKPLQ